MLKKIWEGILIAASLFAVYLMLEGAKSVFHEEKVYFEAAKNIYHYSPYCEAVEGMTDYDRELMEESGDVWGTKPMSAKDAYYDTKIEMCDYCYSPMEINKRHEYNAQRKEK